MPDDLKIRVTIEDLEDGNTNIRSGDDLALTLVQALDREFGDVYYICAEMVDEYQLIGPSAALLPPDAVKAREEFIAAAGRLRQAMESYIDNMPGRAGGVQDAATTRP